MCETIFLFLKALKFETSTFVALQVTMQRLDLTRLNFAFKELATSMPRCGFKRAESQSCMAKWRKNERYADAVVVLPGRMVPAVGAAVAALKQLRVWDQHPIYQQLRKRDKFGYGDANVSTLITGFWDSNPDKRTNPVFSLARKQHH